MLDLQKQVMPLLIAGRGPKREYNTSAVNYETNLCSKSAKRYHFIRQTKPYSVLNLNQHAYGYSIRKSVQGYKQVIDSSYSENLTDLTDSLKQSMVFEICISVTYFGPERQTYSSKFLERNAAALRKRSRRNLTLLSRSEHICQCITQLRCSTLRFGIF